MVRALSGALFPSGIGKASPEVFTIITNYD